VNFGGLFFRMHEYSCKYLLVSLVNISQTIVISQGYED
jgi:hypothetical protein